MNLISDLESEIAFAVLIDKKHSEKINSAEALPLIKRINAALESVSSKDEMPKTIALAAKSADNISH